MTTAHQELKEWAKEHGVVIGTWVRSCIDRAIAEHESILVKWRNANIALGNTIEELQKERDEFRTKFNVAVQQLHVKREELYKETLKERDDLKSQLEQSKSELCREQEKPM